MKIGKDGVNMRECGKIKVMLICLFCVSVFCGVSSCSSRNVDYTDYFSIQDITQSETEDNTIELHCEVSNFGKRDDLVFCVSAGGNEEKLSVNAGETSTQTLAINIGRPEDYHLTYDVTFTVRDNGETVWTKTDSVEYDCKEMFVHPAKIQYGDNEVEVELTDYRSNYFDLAQLFPGFDKAAVHKVTLKGASNDIAKIQESETSDSGTDIAPGGVLKLLTFSMNEPNDTYHFTDNLQIVIKDAVTAFSVDWEQHLEFTDEADYQTNRVAGMTTTTFKMIINVDNPSDEDVYASIVKFYVNDTAIDNEYLVGSNHDRIDARSSGEAYSITSAPVWESTGEGHINRFGMELVLEDGNGNVLYDDVQWLELA